MFKARFLGLGAFVAMLATCVPQAFANYIDAVTGSATCNSYSLQVTENDLTPGGLYQINWDLTFTPTSGTPITVNSSTTFTAGQVNGVVQNLTEPIGPLIGTYAVSGSITLQELDNPSDVGISNPFPVSFAVSTVKCAVTPPPPTCSKNTSISNNFNNTSIPNSDSIWFNANFMAKGIPSTGATITFTNSTISFWANGQSFNLPVPNAQITFTPSVKVVTTTFNSLTNTWDTTSPIGINAEIFLTGLSWRVPSQGLQGGVKNVTWQGTYAVTPSTANVQIEWRWGAAAYWNFTTNYNALGIKAAHYYSGGQDIPNNNDEVGTPENIDGNNNAWKKHLQCGATGNGGCNYTGTFSCIVTLQLDCACNDNKGH